MSWIDTSDSLRLLEKQANALAEKLGHKITGWVTRGRASFARCIECYEGCHVSREFSQPPISGVAVTFDCTKPEHVTEWVIR